MVEYTWPERGNTSVLGSSATKIDAPAKCTGAAKYSYDINPEKMLLARVLGCPLAHCKVKSLDTSAAEKIKGVVAVQTLKNIERALIASGASLRDVVRTRMFITDVSRWEEVARAHGEVFSDIRPAATMLQVVAMVSPEMLVEIEADAIIAAELK